MKKLLKKCTIDNVDYAVGVNASKITVMRDGVSAASPVIIRVWMGEKLVTSAPYDGEF
jgi:hypothetical protein